MSRPVVLARPLSIPGSLTALVGGFVAGALLHGSEGTVVVSLAEIAEAFGQLWLRALQLAVTPLVLFSLLVAVTRLRPGGGIGRVGAVTIGVFVAVLAVGAAYSMAVSPLLIGFGSFDSSAFLALSPETSQVVPEQQVSHAIESATSGILAWVPTNVFGALAAGDVFQILVVGLLFGVAVIHLPEPQRELLTGIFRAVHDAILVLVQWVLRFTNPAVFGMTLGFARATDTGVLTAALGHYVIAVSVLLIGFTVVLYVIGLAVTKAPARSWARAMLPAHTVALSTRSSLATLPVLIHEARSRLDLSPTATDFVLPLAAATLKANHTVSLTMKLLFLAEVYRVDITLGDVCMFAAVVGLLSFTAVGIPLGGGLGRTLPLFVALGIPAEGYVLLKTLEVIPDVFKTVCNTTGYMTSAVLVTRLCPDVIADLDAPGALGSGPGNTVGQSSGRKERESA